MQYFILPYWYIEWARIAHLVHDAGSCAVTPHSHSAEVCLYGTRAYGRNPDVAGSH